MPCKGREGVWACKKRVQSSKFKVEEQKAHNFIQEDFFEKAEFCAACHQLDEGYELNGEPLTDTYMEWKRYYGMEIGRI